uniref:TatD family hydrolase n=1 Tax=Pedobacter schmidteae TaxID=2201271 RepID=UPI000EB2D89D|nr:TatD family hydrolase [Pedobacter schmidteae]
MQFLDIHTHHEGQAAGTISILSISLTGDSQELFPMVIERAIASGGGISVGLHPWFATLTHLERDYQLLELEAKRPEVKMIGECGLDRLKGESLHNQLMILRKQLSLAEELRKPVILHCVRCFDELMGLKKEMNMSVPMIIHGFNKNEALGRQLLSKGFYLSFGKAILNPNSGAAVLLKEADIFFLETDDADCGIAEIYEVAANLKKCTVAELKALIFANWEKII